MSKEVSAKLCCILNPESECKYCAKPMCIICGTEYPIKDDCEVNTNKSKAHFYWTLDPI